MIIDLRSDSSGDVGSDAKNSMNTWTIPSSANNYKRVTKVSDYESSRMTSVKIIYDDSQDSNDKFPSFVGSDVSQSAV